MNIEDPIYGRAEIEEPVLLALMESAAMRRLRGVLQHGITGLLGITKPTTRYEHSVGVMLLVQRFGATLPEQIAALLHDVSHTAFSHVIDYVFNGHDRQSYHEEMKAQYIRDTDIPVVLSAYGYDWQDFLEEERYTLLEQPAPALCADRLDYFLRDSFGLGLASPEQIQFALDHLIAQDGRIVVDSLPAARWLGDTFIAADDASWSNFREVGLYELTAQVIRMGLELGVLSEAELWSTDAHAWERLKASPNPELQAQIRLVSPNTRFVWDEDQPTFRLSTKVRTIDPPVLLNGHVAPLSELDTDFADRRLAYLARKQGKWPMRVIS
jgi:hypothetical protein